ncbi:MAG TPA: hypothetical protein VFP63_03000 [Dehalococcoidia bacterium]|nr:hypothetical protein [Dehalococcoidia bacterium]
MSTSDSVWGVAAVYLLPACIAMLGAAWAGRIHGRLLASLTGFVVAFGVFAFLWLTGSALLLDTGESDGGVEWWLAALVTVFVATPVGLLGGFVALVGAAKNRARA